MQISVRTLDGRSINLQVEPTDTVLTVKKLIQKETSIRADLQRLIFADEQLQNSRSLSSYNGISNKAILQLTKKSVDSTNIVAGGFGQGNKANELYFPYGLAVDGEETLIIADWGNHRIVEWKIGAEQGKVIAGDHVQGKNLNQLSSPTDVAIDKQTNSLFICDRGNRRVVQWSRQNDVNEGQIFVDKITCWGLAIDDQRSIYVSDTEKHEVRRYEIGKQDGGTVVAGGHGRGSRLNQLNEPSYIFVDQHKAVYISDTKNCRVIKWSQGASEGVVVATGFPRGLYVDSSETVFVADYSKHRLMRWPKGAKEGIVISNGTNQEDDINQVYYPWALALNQQEELFVSDHLNHRVQRFKLQQ